MLHYLVSRTSRRCAAVGIIALVATSDFLDDNNSFLTRTPISCSVLLRQLFHPSDIVLQGFASPLLFSSPIGGLFPFGAGAVLPDNIKKEESQGDKNNVNCGPGCLGRNAIANAAAAAGPSVVNISVSRGIHGLILGKSMGSGTIIDSNGTILTCAHVVVDFEGIKSISKGKVDVTLQDGREFEGDVVSADIQSDIAVVKIKCKTPLLSAKLGSSSKLRPGDWVLAMGCPLSLQNTVTAGIVRRVIRPWLGLKMLDLNSMVITQLKERDSSFPNVIRGVLILMVTPGSPAEHAGFQPGDVVTEFDGKPISSIKEIIEIMGDKLGVPIKVIVNRANNKTATLMVVPEEANYDR